MRVVLAVLAAFVIGFVGGGYAPRSDLERTRAELAAAHKREEELSRRGPPAWAAGLGQLMQAQQSMAERTPPVAAPPGSPRPSAVDLGPAFAVARDHDDDDDEDKDDRAAPDGGVPSLRDPANFKRMRDAALLRAEQYRSRFVEAAGFDQAGAARLDGVIKDMNTEFSREAERAVRRLEGQTTPPRPRDFVDSMIPLLQAYQRADDSLRSFAPPGAPAAAADTGFDLATQIDPGAFESVLQILDRLPKRRGAQGDDQ